MPMWATRDGKRPSQLGPQTFKDGNDVRDPRVLPQKSPSGHSDPEKEE